MRTWLFGQGMQRISCLNVGGRWVLTVSLLLVGLCSTNEVFAQDLQAPPELTIPDSPSSTLLTLSEDHLPGMVGKYWLGIAVNELPQVVREQLKIENGVVVATVLPDSPAAKVGLKQNDIILRIGEAPVGSPQELIKLVEETEGKEVAVEFLRQGEKQSVQVAPIERPVPVAPVRPGIEFQPMISQPRLVQIMSRTFEAPLPDDMEVSVFKKGKEPARIQVKKGDKSWETTLDKLSELPEEVRFLTQHLLGRSGTPSGAVSVIVRDGDRNVVFGFPGQGEIPGLNEKVREHLERARAQQEKAQAQFKKHHEEMLRRAKEHHKQAPGLPHAQPEEGLNHRLQRLEDQLQRLEKKLEKILPAEEKPAEKKPTEDPPAAEKK